MTSSSTQDLQLTLIKIHFCMIYAFVTPIAIPLNDPVASLTMFILLLSTVLSLMVLADLIGKRAKNRIFYVSHILNIIAQLVNMIGLIVSEEPFVSFGECLAMTCALFICLSQVEILRLFTPFAVSGRVVNRIWIATWVLFAVFATPVYVYNVMSFLVDCPGNAAGLRITGNINNTYHIYVCSSVWIIDSGIMLAVPDRSINI